MKILLTVSDPAGSGYFSSDLVFKKLESGSGLSVGSYTGPKLLKNKYMDFLLFLPHHHYQPIVDITYLKKVWF